METVTKAPECAFRSAPLFDPKGNKQFNCNHIPMVWTMPNAEAVLPVFVSAYTPQQLLERKAARKERKLIRNMRRTFATSAD